MVPIATRTLINFSFLLIIGVNLVSSGEYSGVLARLYKKAAQQDRPLILVLDNGHHGASRNVAKPHKHNIANLESNKDLAPLVYLYQLGQAQKKKQLAKTPLKYTKSLPAYRDDYRSNSRSRLRDRRERQQLRGRVDDSDRRPDQRDRREDRREVRFRNDDDVLSSPLLRNLLEITNNLLRQKADSCEDTKNDECEASAEKKVEVVESGCDDEKDQCDDTKENDQISTKGELYVPEHVDNKCIDKKCH